MLLTLSNIVFSNLVFFTLSLSLYMPWVTKFLHEMQVLQLIRNDPLPISGIILSVRYFVG